MAQRNQTWVQKTGEKDQDAHLVRLFRIAYFEAACGEIISRNSFVRVSLKRVDLMYYPYFSYKPDVPNVCKICQSKAD